MAARFAQWSYVLISLAVPANAQESLPQIEARAAERKAHGDAAGALAAWQKAARLDPKSARIEDEIGFLLAVLQRPDEAIRHFERAIQLDAHLPAAQYHLGVAYWIQGDPARSIPHLQSAVALDDGYVASCLETPLGPLSKVV